MTDLLYQLDAYLREFDAVVTRVDGNAVYLDRTAFYPTGGGQPHDLGTLAGAPVVEVRKDGDEVKHVLDGPLPQAGQTVHGEIDWERRHQLMRTHTALHILCGVIWREFQAPVTGGNMEPLKARMDFELETTAGDFGERVRELANKEIAADRPISVRILPRAEAFAIPDLIRTKVSLLPEGIEHVRVVDIQGLDLQADGGTHVASTGEVGRIVITGHESKGRINKRLRLALE
ncbi:MAG TPA: alanyl-tRNA editing protein [Chloroflexota bacterium]|nr:alanyl-tRNA editing protein [Chloroflexota bacterium]